MAREGEGGDCYEAAAMLLLFGELKDREGAVLVHGRPIGTGPLNGGKRFNHAWCEFAGLVWDFSNGRENVLPTGTYYVAGQIAAHDCVRYTQEEAREKILESEVWGPWAAAEVDKPEAAAVT